jgi:hypothetical protein
MAFLFRMDYTRNRQQVERPWLNHRRIAGAFLLSASPKWQFHFRASQPQNIDQAVFANHARDANTAANGLCARANRFSPSRY